MIKKKGEGKNLLGLAYFHGKKKKREDLSNSEKEG